MNLFVAFDTLTRVSGGLVAEGSAPVVTAITAAKPDLAVTEMAAVPQTGKLTFCRVVTGILKVGVELWDALAIAKCINRVYAGLCLIGTPGTGNTVVIDKCALVDHPLALGKAASANSALPLRIDEVFKMAIPSKTAPTNGQPANPYSHIVVDGSAANNQLALDLIKYCRTQPMKAAPGASDKEFFQWLQRNNNR